MQILSVPEGMNPIEFIMKFLTSEGEEGARIDLGGEQATAADLNPDYEPEPEETVTPTGRTMLIDIDYFQSVLGEREALAEYIAGLEDRVVCKDCAAASAQELRVFAWAGAKLHASAPSVRWNDLNEVVRQELFRKAQAELAAFDEAQG